MGLNGTSHSFPQSEQMTWVISRGGRADLPPKFELYMVLFQQLKNCCYLWGPTL